MELIHMPRETLASLPAALPMEQYEETENYLQAFPMAVYVNRSTMNVLTDHIRKGMLKLELESIPVFLVEIEPEKEIAAAIAYCGGINANLAGRPASEDDSRTLARYAWNLFRTENGRHILLNMGAEPDYWYSLFDYLEGKTSAESAQTLPAIVHPEPIEQGYDIPSLGPAGQPSRADLLGVEFIAWGTQARNKVLKATHFYTDDSRWKSIESKPEALKDAGVLLAIEANYSSNDDMLMALFLADIYKKRRLAADWISQGIKVIVDLNVSRNFFSEMFLGVPKGWRVYANKYYADDTAHLTEAYELAKEHAQGEITYIVYGTIGAQALCQERGWLWLDSEKSTGWKEGKALLWAGEQA